MPIFKRTFSQDLDLLEHLTKDKVTQTDSNTTLTNLRTKFENDFNLEFKERMQKYTRFDVQSFKDALIFNTDSIGKYMLEIILHQQRTPDLLKQKKLMQTQKDHSNLIPALDVDSLKVDSVVIQNTCSEKEDSNSKTASSKPVKECSLVSATNNRSYTVQIQHMSNVKKSIAKEHVIKDSMKEGGTESEVQENSSRSGNDTDADDAYIRPIYNKELMVEVQLTVECNIFAIGQHHTEQPKIINEDLGKCFAFAALKINVKKLKGNSVDNKFAKTSVLGKPVLQPLKNQSIVRQPNTFKSERPQMSKQQFASQVDANNNLSKLVTQHYLAKKIEFAFAKHDHMIASSSSRNSSKNMSRFSSNDMVYNHYLDKAKEKIQERDRNSKTSVMHTASPQTTTKDRKPKPRSNNQTSKSLPVQSPKTRNNIKPVEKITNVIKPKRWISRGYRVSPNKSFAVHEKPNTPRSCLRWKSTGRIFKTDGLRWILTGKMFTDCTTKVDSEPPNGSNEDITNPYECDQTLNVSVGTLNLSAVQASLFNNKMAFVDNTSGPAPQRKERCTLQCALSSKEEKSSCL
nr:hypothetical protein [Tanacetum cinerariifolium]